jgi:hypothetical protein
MVKDLFGDAAILRQPVLGIAPKALTAIYMISAIGMPFVFPDDHIISTHGQGGVCLPIVGVVQAAGFSIISDDGQ